MLAIALAVVTSTLGAYVALLAFRFSRAPRHADQRPFAWVAATAALYAAGNLVTCTTWLPGAILWTMRLQLAVGLLHVIAWHRFATAHLGRAATHERPLTVVAAALGGLVLWPGAAFGDPVTAWTWRGVLYHDVESTPLAWAAVGVALAGMALVLARFVGAWRRGNGGARLPAASVAVVVALVVNDGLVFFRLHDGPYLLDFGFVVPMAAVMLGLGARVVEDARALDDLRRTLEEKVAERTRALAASEERLAQAEKLVGLGRLAAGVAHELNSPAAIVTSSLRHLRATLAPGLPAPADAAECLRDAEQGMSRITGLARQLLDTGRLEATRDRPLRPVPLRGVAEEAVRMARARVPGAVFEQAVAADLVAFGDEQLLLQAAVNLAVNGAQAVSPARPDGRVRISGEVVGGRARLVVDDDGDGMAPETLRRVFEPFFSTKPFGQGTGLGLAISRALVTAMGGELTLESAPGAGTRATIELPAG